MKKIAVYLLVFLLTFFLLSNAAYSDDDDDDDYPKKRLTITSAQVDQEDEVIYINGKNFGNDPYVMLDEYELDIVDVPTNTLIQAGLPPYLEPGTYRLLVAQRKPKGKLKASKTDTMDVTIGAYIEIDPIFADSPASGIAAEDITNWNAVHGWGNHALAGYLTSYTEIDPIYSAWDKSTGISITQSQITDLDHFTSADETDPVYYVSAAAGISSGDITYWNTAYSWGNHSTAGYVNAADLDHLDAADGSPANAVYVDNDGKVGIGTTTPLHGLTVKKSTWLDGAQHFFYSDSNIALKLSQLANPKFFYLNQDPSGNLNFMSNDVVSRLNIQQDGNVGIGTTSPSERLVVGDNLGTYPGERIVIGGSTPGTLTGLVIGEDSNNRGWMLWSVDDDIMVFGTKVGGALYNTINLKLGNVGIGGWPDSRLKIKGSGNTITTSGLNVSNSDNISSLFVRDDGNVGIGTTSPQDKLDVDGNVRANRFSDTSDTGYYVDPYGSTSATFRGNLSLANDGIFQNPGGGWAMLQNHSGHLYLGPDSSASQSIIFRHGTSDRINFQLDGSANDASPEFRTNGTYLIIGAKEDNPMYLQWDQSAADQHVYVNGYITPNKMYDRDNTAYYIDPSSTGTALTVAGDVGIGTTSPQGKLDVNGAIYQRGSQLHADYVFENDYKLESIKEHADFMWKNKHLKAIPRAKVDNQGQEIVEVGAHRKGIVEELEKAHIYISQLEARLAKLEELLNVRQ